MNIKRNILFSLECRKHNGEPIVENVPIRMRVTYDRNRVDFSTGYRIDASKWDPEKQRVKNGCSNKLKQSASEINADLNHYAGVIQGIFKEFEVQECIPSVEQLKTIFTNRCGKEKKSNKPAPLYPIFDEFILEEGKLNGWTTATCAKLASTKNHLYKFNPKLPLEAFDEKLLDKLVDFMRKDLQMRNSTIGKQLGFLKWFLRWAYRKGYMTNNAFEGFKPKLKTTQKKVIFLTWDELTRLRECKIPASKQYLERVRDVFLFTCFTGLRYSDVYNLKRSDIKEDRIEITTIKTTDSLTIELNDHSRAILAKYQNIGFEKDKALPVISNQRMNEFLKELCQLAGIDEQVHEIYYRGNERIEEITPKYALIGTHAGRRTFICNALSLGIPAQVVMKWTGHNDYKAMKPYIDIADDIKANAMKKFNLL